MNNCPDRRGQAVQVGAIVTLGFVVLAISIFQAQGVPQETVETEVEHNQEIADQLETFNASLAETTIIKTPQTTTLRLGTSYDGRPLFVYPPPTAGSLETTEPGTVVIENATATEDSEPFENYWNNETRTYNTSSIQYDIDYQELRNTPNVTFEYGFYGAQFDNRTQVNSPFNQPVVEGRDISLIVYDGELAERSSRTESVVVERVTHNTTVDLKPDPSTGPITLTLPTELDEEAWNETLDIDSYENGAVTIELDQPEYTLTVHKVDVGSNATQPEPTYLRELEHSNGETTVDVRDAYNDPVDETVGAWVFNGSGHGEEELDENDIEETLRIPPDGVTYKPPNSIEEPCLTIERDLGDANSYETLYLDGEGSCL